MSSFEGVFFFVLILIIKIMGVAYQRVWLVYMSACSNVRHWLPSVGAFQSQETVDKKINSRIANSWEPGQ